MVGCDWPVGAERVFFNNSSIVVVCAVAVKGAVTNNAEERAHAARPAIRKGLKRELDIIPPIINVI
jgi:hypothetical protein